MPRKGLQLLNTILKSITSFPIAHKGRGLEGAHLSRVGNVAYATCDLWSNESIQKVKLLSTMAPVVGMEQLANDCRLDNKAITEGTESARTLQRWLVESDSSLDPQADILWPDVAIPLGEAIVAAPTPFEAGLAVAQPAVAVLQDAVNHSRLKIPAREEPWPEMGETSLSEIPCDEESFVAPSVAVVDPSMSCPADRGVARPHWDRTFCGGWCLALNGIGSGA